MKVPVVTVWMSVSVLVLLVPLLPVLVRGENHTNNWAVIVSASRFWFNYRHNANALAIYRTVRRLGIPDSHVLLMLSDDVACNARNAFPAQVFISDTHRDAAQVYGEHIEVDYRSAEVTVETFLRVLEGRHDKEVPLSKRLLSNEDSNVLIYLTGHGGAEFLKFQDAEELTSADLADSIEQMHAHRRFRELMLMVDTCQAATLHARIRTPGVVAIGCADRGENSYSYRSDSAVGLSVIDRFTFHTLDYFEKHSSTPGTLADLFAWYTFPKLNSHARWHNGLARNLSDVPTTDFFGSVLACSVTPDEHAISWW
jgi:phosphatidylinositol glycan class K